MSRFLFRVLLHATKSVGGLISLHRRARMVTLLVPRRHWYRMAVRMSRLHARMTGAAGGNRVLTEALLLDSWLQELTLSGAYPIPWRAAKMDGVENGDMKGVLFCWTHLPLFRMPLHAWIDMGYEPPQVVADPGNIDEAGELIVPGQTKRAQTISTGSHVLVKLRTVLREGGSVACLADTELGAPISSTVLRIAAQAGARVVFQWAERQPDGVIDIYFINAPRPLNESEEDIEINMEFLRVENRRILDSLGVRESGGERVQGVRDGVVG